MDFQTLKFALAVGMLTQFACAASKVQSVPVESAPARVASAPAGAHEPVPVVPSRLGATRLARIESAYANLRIAIADWKLETYGRDCLLVFNEREEWLVGCPELEGKAGFLATTEERDGKKVLWNGKSVTVSDSYLPYEQVKRSLVGTVATRRADDGATSPILVVQEWDALHGQHPGFTQSPLEEWLGVFVHEAFHARQMWHPRIRAIVERWTDDKRPVQPDELAAFYKGNEAFRVALAKEAEVLRAATDDPSLDPAKARAALAQWLGLYRAREATFAPALEKAFPGRDAWFMDGFETFLEGSARYVEARFLTAPQSVSFALLKDETTFQRFEHSKGKRPSQLPGLGNVGAKYFYAIGMYLCFVLDVADPTWKSKLFDSDRLLLGQVERVVAAKH